MVQLVLFSSGRQDKRLTVDGETKHLLSSGHSKTVVWQGVIYPVSHRNLRIEFGAL